MSELTNSSQTTLVNMTKQKALLQKSLKQLNGDLNDLDDMANSSSDKIDVVDNDFQITEQMMKDLT